MLSGLTSPWIMLLEWQNSTPRSTCSILHFVFILVLVLVCVLVIECVLSFIFSPPPLLLWRAIVRHCVAASMCVRHHGPRGGLLPMIHPRGSTPTTARHGLPTSASCSFRNSLLPRLGAPLSLRMATLRCNHSYLHDYFPRVSFRGPPECFCRLVLIVSQKKVQEVASFNAVHLYGHPGPRFGNIDGNANVWVWLQIKLLG